MPFHAPARWRANARVLTPPGGADRVLWVGPVQQEQENAELMAICDDLLKRMDSSAA